DDTPVAAAPPEPVASDVAVETPVWSDDAPAAEPPALGADVPPVRERAAPEADAVEASEAPVEAPYAWLDRLTSYEPPFSRGPSPTVDAEAGEEVIAEPPSVDEQTLSASLEAALRAALPPSRPVPTEDVPPLIPFAPPPTSSLAADETPAFAIGADEPPTPTPTIEAATTDDAVPVAEVRAPAPAPVAPPRDVPAPVTAAPVVSDVETPPRAADVETPRVAPGAIVMPPLGQRPVITLREPRTPAPDEPAPAPAPRAAKPGETDFDRIRGAAAAPPTARPQSRSRSPRRVAAIAAVALIAATGVGALVYGRRTHESTPRLASRGARAADSTTVATTTAPGVAATDSARARGEDTSGATASSNYGARGSTLSVPPVVVSTASLSPSLPIESMRMATTGEHRAAGRRAAGAARPARPATAPAATLSTTERAAASALASAERLLAQRDYRAARAAAEQAVTLAPRGPRGYVVRSRVRLHQGELREAWADAEMAARLGDLLSAQAATAIVEERAGDTASARIRVERLARAVDARGDALAPRDNALLAMALAAVGDAAAASEALHRLPNDAARAAAIGDPSFDGVRRDPRFRPYDGGGRRSAADSTRRRP
ncbi:MAG TPA: hypothetical protein VFJ74_07745, partial [Gemmatimonadaceae bacterium]|nr:hypothetical protein [Gemmatimonadaceae bacterium]